MTVVEYNHRVCNFHKHLLRIDSNKKSPISTNYQVSSASKTEEMKLLTNSCWWAGPPTVPALAAPPWALSFWIDVTLALQSADKPASATSLSIILTRAVRRPSEGQMLEVKRGTWTWRWNNELIRWPKENSLTICLIADFSDENIKHLLCFSFISFCFFLLFQPPLFTINTKIMINIKHFLKIHSQICVMCKVNYWWHNEIYHCVISSLCKAALDQNSRLSKSSLMMHALRFLNIFGLFFIKFNAFYW